MKPDWGDLIARATGLGTHILHRGDLAALAHLPDLPALAVELSRRGFPIDQEAPVTAAALDLAARRDAAAHLQTLAHWSGARSEILAVIFEDEDRRALRAIVRGAVQHAAAESRLSGLLPTPSLPERALHELADQPSVAKIAAILVAWEHPYGPALLAQMQHPEPDLLALEVQINRTFAARSLRGARRAGKRGVLVWYVRRTIDLENAYSALALSGEPPVEHLPDLFIPAGEIVSRTLFESAAKAGDLSAAGRLLGGAFAGTPLASVFLNANAIAAGDLERLVLGTEIGELRRRAFQDPLGPTPVLLDALRGRAAVLDLRQLIWGISLDAPRPALAGALVSAP